MLSEAWLECLTAGDVPEELHVGHRHRRQTNRNESCYVQPALPLPRANSAQLPVPAWKAEEVPPIYAFAPPLSDHLNDRYDLDSTDDFGPLPGPCPALEDIGNEHISSSTPQHPRSDVNDAPVTLDTESALAALPQPQNLAATSTSSPPYPIGSIVYTRRHHPLVQRFHVADIRPVTGTTAQWRVRLAHDTRTKRGFKSYIRFGNTELTPWFSTHYTEAQYRRTNAGGMTKVETEVPNLFQTEFVVGMKVRFRCTELLPRDLIVKSVYLHESRDNGTFNEPLFTIQARDEATDEVFRACEDELEILRREEVEASACDGELESLERGGAESVVDYGKPEVPRAHRLGRPVYTADAERTDVVHEIPDEAFWIKTGMDAELAMKGNSAVGASL